MKTHIKINSYFVAAIFLLLLFLTLCTEPPKWDNENYNPTPPGAVSNPRVVNINGGAIIYYTLPPESSTDLLGVKALYSFHEGGEMLEVNASAYTDSIVLVGFPNTKERNVTLITYNKSRVESQPVEVTIHPLTPPVELVRNSLIVNETFGGVFVSWENPTKADIGVSLYAEDSLGYLSLDYTYFTNKTGDYTFRGYVNEARNFRIELKDRWGNMAIPLDTLLTPLFEEYVVARDLGGNVLWERYGYADQTHLWRGDVRSHYSVHVYEAMFDCIRDENDNLIDVNNYFNTALEPEWSLHYYTGIDEGFTNVFSRPYHITIDMTRETKLSRYIYWYRPGALNPGDAYHLSFWATNEKPKGPADFDNDRMASLTYWTTWPEVGGTGAWKDDWVHVGELYVVPPSGGILSHNWTAADLAWAQAGVEEDFFAEYSNLPFRYLRIELHSNISGGYIIHFTELEVFGSVVR